MGVFINPVYQRVTGAECPPEAAETNNLAQDPALLITTIRNHLSCTLEPTHTYINTPFLYSYLQPIVRPLSYLKTIVLYDMKTIVLYDIMFDDIFVYVCVFSAQLLDGYTPTLPLDLFFT